MVGNSQFFMGNTDLIDPTLPTGASKTPIKPKEKSPSAFDHKPEKQDKSFDKAMEKATKKEEPRETKETKAKEPTEKASKPEKKKDDDQEVDDGEENKKVADKDKSKVKEVGDKSQQNEEGNEEIVEEVVAMLEEIGIIIDKEMLSMLNLENLQTKIGELLDGMDDQAEGISLMNFLDLLKNAEIEFAVDTSKTLEFQITDEKKVQAYVGKVEKQQLQDLQNQLNDLLNDEETFTLEEENVSHLQDDDGEEIDLQKFQIVNDGSEKINLDHLKDNQNNNNQNNQDLNTDQEVIKDVDLMDSMNDGNEKEDDGEDKSNKNQQAENFEFNNQLDKEFAFARHESKQKVEVTSAGLERITSSYKSSDNMELKVVQQVTKNVKLMINQNQNQMQLQLNPEHLGKMDIHISMKDQQMHLNLVVKNEAVKTIIEGNLIQLVDNLDLQDVELEEVMISLRDHSDEKERQKQEHKKEDEKNGDEEENGENFGLTFANDVIENDTGRRLGLNTLEFIG